MGTSGKDAGAVALAEAYDSMSGECDGLHGTIAAASAALMGMSCDDAVCDRRTRSALHHIGWQLYRALDVLDACTEALWVELRARDAKAAFEGSLEDAS